jgi:hypothetical protein
VPGPDRFALEGRVVTVDRRFDVLERGRVDLRGQRIIIVQVADATTDRHPVSAQRGRGGPPHEAKQDREQAVPGTRGSTAQRGLPAGRCPNTAVQAWQL